MTRIARRCLDRRRHGLGSDWSLKAPIPYVVPLWQRFAIVALVIVVIIIASGGGR